MGELGRDFILGVLTSVIGSLVLTALKPPGVSFRRLNGDLLLWMALSVISIIMGCLIGITACRSFANAFFIIVRDQELATLLSVTVSVCLGIVGSVGFFRILRAQM